MKRSIVRGLRTLPETVRRAITSSRGRFDVLATRHVTFLALVIRHELEAAGYRSAIYYHDEIWFDKGQPFVVLSPNVITRLPRTYVAFQLEQSARSNWFTPEYWSRLSAARQAWDYSIENIDYLASNGLARDRITHIPISSVPNFFDLLRAAYPGFSATPLGALTVLFYGDPHSPRRAKFLQELQRTVDVQVIDKTYGCALYEKLARASLVVNIHYYEQALLETTRLSECLSLGVPVVSEAASDQQDHSSLTGPVVFTPIGDVSAMALAVKRFLDDPDHRLAHQAQARACQARDRRFQAALRDAIRDLGSTTSCCTRSRSDM